MNTILGTSTRCSDLGGHVTVGFEDDIEDDISDESILAVLWVV